MTQPDNPTPPTAATLRAAAEILATSGEWLDGHYHQGIVTDLRAAADGVERQAVQARDRELRDCEWSDYRKNYGVRTEAMTDAHRAFIAGWDAARGETYEGGALT